ncbi:MAG: class IV adenylate cyclase [Chloroflexi bacterium]|nr:class IV adenylate cyclase [Chloroflexota bacterium]
MPHQNTELEVKFYISDLGKLEERIETLGAKLVQPRTLEYNLRFDTLNGELARSYQVLRLRRDTANRLTYKGPGVILDGVRLRKEIEFEVGDFDNARALIEALGYRVSMIYEKYRAVYELDGVLITLDEMPYGNFTEIEGPDAASIQAANRRLGLDWEARILDSYAMLFQVICRKLGLTFRDLTFDNFAGTNVTSANLGVRPADG